MSPQDRTRYSREYMRSWRKLHPERSRATSKKSHLKLETKFSCLKSEAKRRKLEVTITLEQYKILVTNPCFYCGGTLPLGGGGLDRIDSKIGYVQGNVRPCCTQCNIAKSFYTETEFKEWVLRLYNHWISRDQ